MVGYLAFIAECRHIFCKYHCLDICHICNFVTCVPDAYAVCYLCDDSAVSCELACEYIICVKVAEIFSVCLLNCYCCAFNVDNELRAAEIYMRDSSVSEFKAFYLIVRAAELVNYPEAVALVANEKYHIASVSCNGDIVGSDALAEYDSV